MIIFINQQEEEPFNGDLESRKFAIEAEAMAILKKSRLYRNQPNEKGISFNLELNMFLLELDQPYACINCQMRLLLAVQSFFIRFDVNIQKTIDHENDLNFHKIWISDIEVSGSNHLELDRGYYIEKLEIVIKPGEAPGAIVRRKTYSPLQKLPDGNSNDWMIRTGHVPLNTRGIRWEYSHRDPSIHKIFTYDLSEHSVTYQWSKTEPPMYLIEIKEVLRFSKSPTNDDTTLVNCATVELAQHPLNSDSQLQVKPYWWLCNAGSEGNAPTQCGKSASLACACCRLTARLWNDGPNENSNVSTKTKFFTRLFRV